jgi:hypothetical protein
MGRPRRQILSNHTYEICFRTRRGLPFVATLYMKLLIGSVLANVQKTDKVIISHLLAMANHFHMIAVAKDQLECTRFYGEVQKQLTEVIKRLLGLRHLNLWPKNGVSVIEYGDRESVEERIAYLYANPARAHLVDVIERYPGFNSWEAFQNTTPIHDASYSTSYSWVQLRAITKLPARALTRKQDETYTQRLKESCWKEHLLTLRPNAWMKCFGIHGAEIASTNRRIMVLLREKEGAARSERQAKSGRTKGESQLAQEAISMEHEPKKSYRIFVHAANPTLKAAMIERFARFCDQCRYCYECWKRGDHRVVWPAGSFRPPMPPTINWLVA